MIRAANKQDFNQMMDIWLRASEKAHDFIHPSYWREHFDEVKNTYLAQAKSYIWEEDEKVLGFVSVLNDRYIGAIFVDTYLQGRGIGSKLMKFIQTHHDELSLNVYVKNKASVCFYEKHGFMTQEEKLDENTGEKEFSMLWKAQ